MTKLRAETVLIIEDEESMLRLLSDSFKNEGFAVVEAKDGRNGLELALAKKPDIILLDLLLPKMDGMSMLKELRKDAWGKNVPVMILTNVAADNQAMKNISETEPSYYLVKTDWKIDDVVGKVKERLEITKSKDQE